MAAIKAALWLRVSGPGQETANQRMALEQEAQRRGYDIVQVFTVEESGWRGGHLKAL